VAEKLLPAFQMSGHGSLWAQCQQEKSPNPILWIACTKSSAYSENLAFFGVGPGDNELIAPPIKLEGAGAATNYSTVQVHLSDRA